MSAEAIAERFRRYQARGVAGVWARQTFGPPFGPLSAVAMETSTMKLGTGIALAFTRSPLETACAAIDLDRLSGGRCVLGLGSSAAHHIERHFGSNYGKPLAHMREVISIIRAIVSDGHNGTLGAIKGDYYDLDFTGFRLLEPPLRERIPIYLPGIFEKGCELAGELADGILGHPIWTADWIEEKVLPSLEAGLAKSDRGLSGFDVQVSPFVMITDDIDQAMEDSRATVAMYCTAPEYNRFFDFIGFGDAARRVQAAQASGDFAGMVSACPDDLVQRLVTFGSETEIRDRLSQRTRRATACLPMIADTGLTSERAAYYLDRLETVFFN